MAQKGSRQQNVKQAYKKEDAYQTLGIINTWISNLDTKVSFALALIGVLTSMIFSEGLPNAFQRVTEISKLAELNGGEIIAAILVFSLYLVSFVSILYFMLAIMAKIKNTNNAQSIFFFGSLSGMEPLQYKDIVKNMTEQQIIEDLEEQIHTNSIICSKKAKCYNTGIKFSVATIILWFICMTFRLI